MRCGAKCFLVEMELVGKRRIQPVDARTAAGARKVIRAEFGSDVQILSVKEEKRD